MTREHLFNHKFILRSNRFHFFKKKCTRRKFACFVIFNHYKRFWRKCAFKVIFIVGFLSKVVKFQNFFKIVWKWIYCGFWNCINRSKIFSKLNINFITTQIGFINNFIWRSVQNQTWNIFGIIIWIIFKSFTSRSLYKNKVKWEWNRAVSKTCNVGFVFKVNQIRNLVFLYTCNFSINWNKFIEIKVKNKRLFLVKRNKECIAITFICQELIRIVKNIWKRAIINSRKIPRRKTRLVFKPWNCRSKSNLIFCQTSVTLIFNKEKNANSYSAQNH